MRALVYDTTLKLVTDYTPPRPSPDEALIRVLLAGICNTDLEITRGYMGGPSLPGYRHILGHEFVGQVVEARDADWIGQRVVGEINCACQECPTCLRGDAPHCPNRTTLGIDRRPGVLAEACVLPLCNLHRVPDEIADQQAVFVEPLAAALEVTERLHVRPTERVVVIGDGKLGLLVAQVLRLTACDLLVIGHHERNLAILKDQGVDVRLEEQLPHDLAAADVVVDCTGHPSGFTLARSLVRPRGCLVLKSTFHADEYPADEYPADGQYVPGNPVDLVQMVVDEVTLMGSRCGPFAPALRLLERGLVNVEPLIEAEFPLDQALDAFQLAEKRGTLKVLMRP
jgi:alcohol dehydrogenase